MRGTAAPPFAALADAHRQYLGERGLTAETIAASGCYTARPGDLSRLAGRPVPEATTGLVIPYPNAADFCRVRLFPPIPRADGKAQKFGQPQGTGVRAYITPQAQGILSDPSVSLAVTEGEVKSIALGQAGFPCIGLGGVWNFRTRDLPPGAMVADLEGISWTGRIVRLFPDSDAWQNEQVLLAVFTFARLLEQRGATVLITQLPTLPGQGKTGADDFLVAKGQAAFRRLVEKAVTLGHPTFRPFREREKSQARAAKAARPVPANLEGRRIHPALHFDTGDGFASVGILDSGAWIIVTSDGAEHPAEALEAILTPEVAPYPALGERWRAVARAAFLRGEAPAPSWAAAVATALELFRDYIEFDEEPPYAVLALWVLGTYFYPVFPSFPRLNLHGEKGSGKSKTLKLVAALSHNGLWRTAPRAAPLFRLIEVLRPTMCLDELEHLDRDDKGDIAAILNAGYQAGGAVDRCDPVTFNVRPFAVYAPVALAGIKGLNAVLADRCISIIMQAGRDLYRVNRDVDLTAPDPRILTFRDLAYRLALTRWREARGAWAAQDLPRWLSGRSRELWAPMLTMARLASTEAPDLDLRLKLLALARPDAEDRAELPEVASAILTALETRLLEAEAVTIQPGELAGELKAALGYDLAPQGIGLRLKALGFRRDRGRKGGSFYRVTLEAIRGITERRRLAEDAGPASPQES